MKTVCIHQPDFIPWLGFFHRLVDIDELIILDDVQFLRRGWHHRDYIKTQKGEKWLTLSIQKGDYNQKISETILAPGDEWKSKILSQLKECYKKAPYYATYIGSIEEIFNKPHTRMIDLNMDFLNFLLGIFNINIKVRLSSSLAISSSQNLRLIELLKKVDATSYITGLGSKSYLDEQLFADNNIRVVWQNFKHPVYSQQFDGFIPGMSSLDALFNVGPEIKSLIR